MMRTLKKNPKFVGYGGLHEQLLEKNIDYNFKLTKKGRMLLTVYNNLINHLDKIDVVFSIEDKRWNVEYFIELTKKVVHKDNKDIIFFGSDLTQVVFRGSIVTGVWLKMEFKQPRLYIFIKKIPRDVHSSRLVL